MMTYRDSMRGTYKPIDTGDRRMYVPKSIPSADLKEAHLYIDDNLLARQLEKDLRDFRQKCGTLGEKVQVWRKNKMLSFEWQSSVESCHPGLFSQLLQKPFAILSTFNTPDLRLDILCEIRRLTPEEKRSPRLRDYTTKVVFRLCAWVRKGMGIAGIGFGGKSLSCKNLMDALHNISMRNIDKKDNATITKKTREEWENGVNATIEANYLEKPMEGKYADMVCVSTGLVLRPIRDVLTEEDNYDFHGGEEIFLILQNPNGNDLENHFSCFLRIAETEVPIDNCIKALYREIDCRAVYSSLMALANEADAENWSLNDKAPYGVLQYYIEAIFDRLCKDEDKMTKSSDRIRPFAYIKSDKIFNTGLLNGERYIYARCSQRNSEGLFTSIEWIHRNRPQDAEVLESLAKGVNSTHHGLPYPPNWVREPERLLFDYRYGSIGDGDIDLEYEHIHKNLTNRIFDEEREFANGERMEIRKDFQKRFNRRYPYTPSIYEFFKGEPDPKFKEFLDSAWRKTRKRLQQNFKIAIPSYYQGRIQLLVPLFLDEKHEGIASVALVVALNEGKNPKQNAKTGKIYHYICPTCLSLPMARQNSRVITRIDDTWLSEAPNIYLPKS